MKEITTRTRTGSVAVAVALGAVTGAVAALLLTPYSGFQTGSLIAKAVRNRGRLSARTPAGAEEAEAIAQAEQANQAEEADGERAA
jgi:hypothetical protein